MAEVRALAGGVLVEVDPETLLRAVVVVDPLETRLTVLEGDEELPLGREEEAEGEGLVPTEGREPTEGRADDPSAVDYEKLVVDEPRKGRERERERLRSVERKKYKRSSKHHHRSLISLFLSFTYSPSSHW